MGRMTPLLGEPVGQPRHEGHEVDQEPRRGHEKEEEEPGPAPKAFGARVEGSLFVRIEREAAFGAARFREPTKFVLAGEAAHGWRHLMTMLANQSDREVRTELVKPRPRAPIAIRVATAGDLGFIDALQKAQSRQVGWMPLKQLEAYIARGNVLIAETARADGWEGSEDSEEPRASASGGVETSAGTGAGGMGAEGGPPLPHGRGSLGVGTPLGYCIASDRYFKRDDCGIVYQLNVAPEARRGLVGAALIRAVFERAAYGVRLFCCWCAQDIEANKFWEALGFVPLAFRTGARDSRGRRGSGGGGRGRESRIHIFWQRRVREGDTQTPYWFPCETSGGALREGRIVLPMPPGTRWSDVKPVVLPGEGEGKGESGQRSVGSGRCAVEGGQRKLGGRGQGKRGTGKKEGTVKKAGAAVGPRRSFGAAGLRFAARETQAPVGEGEALGRAQSESRALALRAEGTSGAGRRRQQRRRRVNDPKYVAAARELRDRYLEQVSAGRLVLEDSRGKYDVSRALEWGGDEGGMSQARATRPVLLLEAA